MIEHRDSDGAPGRVVLAATVIISVAAVVVIFRWDRAYQRWLAEISPLARPRAGLRRFRTGFQRKRTNVTEVVQVINDVLDQVAEGRSARASK
jgi:hypothetical protein